MLSTDVNVVKINAYLNVSSGKLKVSKPVANDKGERSYQKSEVLWASGKVVAIKKEDDTIQGQSTTKLKLLIRDGEINYLFSVTLEGWGGQNTLAYLYSEHFNYELVTKIGVNGSDDNEKISFVWMTQKDSKIAKSEVVPAGKKGRNNKTNWDEFLEFADKAVPEIQAKLEKFYGNCWETKPEEETVEIEQPLSAPDGDDEIPF